jgi:hypothetical protein
MNEIYFDIFFELYLLLATAYMLLASTEKQLSIIQRARPGWSEDRCRQFFLGLKTLFIMVTIGFTYHSVRAWHGGHQ